MDKKAPNLPFCNGVFPDLALGIGFCPGFPYSRQYPQRLPKLGTHASVARPRLVPRRSLLLEICRNGATLQDDDRKIPEKQAMISLQGMADNGFYC